MDGDAEFAALASLLRRGEAIPDLVADLAERLERAIPDQVKKLKALEAEPGAVHRVLGVVAVGCNEFFALPAASATVPSAPCAE